jgi:hypothetical protein
MGNGLSMALTIHLHNEAQKTRKKDLSKIAKNTSHVDTAIIYNENLLLPVTKQN